MSYIIYVGVPGTVDYGAYVELGTGKYSVVGGTIKESWTYMDALGQWHRAYPQKPRPYLVPAVRDHAAEYINILKNSLENA